MTEIRPYRPEDALEAAPLIGSGFPQPHGVGPRSLQHWFESAPERARTRAWVAVDGDELVGWSDGALRWSVAQEGVAQVWAVVRADRRGRGLGTQLMDLAEEHVTSCGARELDTYALESEPDSIAFAEERGFRENRREYSWVLYLDEVDLDPPELPEGFRVARLGELRSRERELFDLYDSAHRDMPSDHPLVLEFEEWRRETLENPQLDLEASSVVLEGDRPVSFSWINAEPELGAGSHELTGTHSDFRGRGLARAAKVTTIRWAAESGLRYLVTSNDSTNSPMLAVNERLGYQPRTTIVELVKRLDGGQSGPH